MKIIQATQNELEPLVLLFNGYREFYGQPADLEGAKAFLKERLDLKESVIYLAQSEAGKWMGFTQLYPVFSSVSMERSWLLNDLFVHPNHRKKGVGEALIDAAKQLCATTPAKGLLLETGSDNYPAQALYEKLDFLKEQTIFYFWKR